MAHAARVSQLIQASPQHCCGAPVTSGIGSASVAAPIDMTVTRWRRRLVCDAACRSQKPPRLMPLPGRTSLWTVAAVAELVGEEAVDALHRRVARREHGRRLRALRRRPRRRRRPRPSATRRSRTRSSTRQRPRALVRKRRLAVVTAALEGERAAGPAGARRRDAAAAGRIPPMPQRSATRTRSREPGRTRRGALSWKRLRARRGAHAVGAERGRAVGQRGERGEAPYEPVAGPRRGGAPASSARRVRRRRAARRSARAARRRIRRRRPRAPLALKNSRSMTPGFVASATRWFVSFGAGQALPLLGDGATAACAAPATASTAISASTTCRARRSLPLLGLRTDRMPYRRCRAAARRGVEPRATFSRASGRGTGRAPCRPSSGRRSRGGDTAPARPRCPRSCRARCAWRRARSRARRRASAAPRQTPARRASART